LLRRRVNHLKDYTEEIDKLKELLDTKIERLKSVQSRKEEKETDMLALKNEPKYAEFKKSESERKTIVQKLENNQNQILMFFSKIKFVLKLFLELEPWNKLIKSYLEKPVITFYQDSKLTILNVFKRIKDMISIERIKLEPKQKETTLDLFKVGCSGLLEKLHKENKYFKDKLEQLNQVVADKDFLLRIEETQYKLNHFSKQVEKLEQEVNEIKDEVNDHIILRGKEIELFKNLVKVSLGKDIEVRV